MEKTRGESAQNRHTNHHSTSEYVCREEPCRGERLVCRKCFQKYHSRHLYLPLRETEPTFEFKENRRSEIVGAKERVLKNWEIITGGIKDAMDLVTGQLQSKLDEINTSPSKE